MKITVHYRGRADFPVIGTLADDARGRIFFELDPDWRAGGLELSPIRAGSDTTMAVVRGTGGTPRQGSCLATG